MRQIRWTTEAAGQLEAAFKRIQQDNPTAARNVAQAIIDRIEQLASFSGLGRAGEVKGTRELVISPYVVVYRTTEEIVEILYIWHGAQDWR
ncbi:MAG TPA: type II toxin-antitoxin system RelE/ParE family toxin [Bryobacteraceae bacterium]|nr:type II toxin-antitoxin system RelE/ParE family toxin [Bryobacteraceae bacterium]